MMKKSIALMAIMLLLCCTVPAFADSPKDILTSYDAKLQGTWTLLQGSTRLRGLPRSFTYGEDEGYFLFVTADCRVCLAWLDPENGRMLADQFAEVAFTYDGQYLLLMNNGSASVYVRQAD